MCLYPKLIRNKKYAMTKKNGGIIPPISDERVTMVSVGCGRCKECRKQKAREWQLRLLEDIKHHRNGKFVTLTFNNKSIANLASEIKATGYTLDNAIATLAVRRFLERWRKKYSTSVRHWLITEIGHAGTENIHLHGILWTDVHLDEVEKIWGYGHMWKGKRTPQGGLENYVTARTVNYIVKYVTKVDEKHKHYNSIVLTSPGIGREYVKSYNATRNKYNGKKTVETYRTEQGHKITMPIYWRNKIYTEEEREKLWLKKLDENVRYVGGEKVDISKGMDDYYRVLKHYREINKELGYGDDEKNWQQEEYERQRRILMMKKRINNIKNKGGEGSESPQAGGAGNSKDIGKAGYMEGGVMKRLKSREGYTVEGEECGTIIVENRDDKMS